MTQDIFSKDNIMFRFSTVWQIFFLVGIKVLILYLYYLSVLFSNRILQGKVQIQIIENTKLENNKLNFIFMIISQNTFPQ